MYVNNDIDYMKWLANKELIIFGAGKIGLASYKKFKKLGFHVIGIVDNSPSKQGMLVDGLRISSLEEAEKTAGENTVYIIAVRGYEYEIKMQLLERTKHPFIDIDQIDFSYNDIEYYDEEYFEYQKRIGEKACAVDLLNFVNHINTNDIVVEFGSGGGFLLNLINAKEKVGVEINPYAIENSKKLGIKTVENANCLSDEYADVIISTHALEHVDNPLDILRTLWRKLKPAGKIIFVVPFQGDNYDYRRDDIDNEFWNWNCRTLGNLFKRAGYFVSRVEVVDNQYPPNFASILAETGIETLVCIDKLYSQYSDSKSIKIIARK